MAKKLIGAAILIAVSCMPSMAQDVQKGKTVFNICLACHAIGSGAQNKIGPELNGLDGRKAGMVPNFDYSDANKNSGIMWNEATFEDYIKNPAAKVPDTKMIFPGIKNEQQAKTCGPTSVNSTLAAILKSNPRTSGYFAYQRGGEHSSNQPLLLTMATMVTSAGHLHVLHHFFVRL